MATIEQECMAARGNVESEFTIIKQLSTTDSIRDESKEALRRYLLVGVYAAWEGFVVQVFTIYADKINASGILFGECDKRIGAQIFFQTLNLDNLSNNTEKREKVLCDAVELLESCIKIRTPISTDSNVDFKSLKAIMHKLGLDPLSEEKYNDRMAKFLSIRCKLAHGTCVTIPVELISEMTQLVTELMDDVIDTIVTAYNSNSYRIGR